MQPSNRTYAILNIIALLAPLVSAVPAASQYQAANPAATAEAVTGFYVMGILVALPVLMTMAAARLIQNRKFHVSATILMFTCNLMNAIFFHMAGGGMLVVSVLLLQLFIAVPSLLYGLVLKLRKGGAKPG